MDPVFQAEIFDPETGVWSQLSPPMGAPRVYHSTAVLLPDGTVLSSGGDYEHNAQIYYPPYWNDIDTRPVIDRVMPANGIGYGDLIRVYSRDAERVSKVTLVKLSSVTHAFDAGQRFINMTVTARGDGWIDAVAPLHPGVAPAGPYMLFLISEDGVPSEAKYVRLTSSSESGGGTRGVGRLLP